MLGGGYLFSKFLKVGFFAVAIFFFLSGYGLQKQYINKEDYSKGFLLNRLPKVIIPYIFANIIYLIFYKCLGFKTPLIHNFFIGFFNGDPIVDHSWYIISILLFYIFFYCAMIFCKKTKRKKRSVIILSVIYYFCYITICRKLNYGEWWYISFVAIIVGMIWATYEGKILSITNRFYLFILIFNVCLFLLLYWLLFNYSFSNFFLVNDRYLKLTTISSVIFPICILLFTLKFHFGNYCLDKIGQISLEIYMYHGLFITLFQTKYFMIHNSNLFIIASILFSYLFSIFMNKVDNYALSKYKEKIIKPYNIK